MKLCQLESNEIDGTAFPSSGNVISYTCDEDLVEKPQREVKLPAKSIA